MSWENWQITKKKQRSLLESAYDLFLNKGFENTVVSDIVMKAGVAKGTFYLYFKDKHQVRDVLIARTAEKFFRGTVCIAKEKHLRLYGTNHFYR